MSVFGLGGSEMVSVDLGEDVVKIARAAIGMGGNPSVFQLASLNIAGLSDEAIAHVIATSLMELGLKSRSAIAIVPTSLVVTRNIEVPSIDADEVRNIVVLQASRHTPYAREDIIADYINMGVYKDTYTRVLLVVTGQEKIRRQLDILTASGLRVEKMLFGPEVVSRMTDQMVDPESVEPVRGIIHVSEASTDFIVANGPRPIFVRSYPIGTRQLESGADEDRAKFVGEVVKSLEVYRTEEIEKSPSAFILTGALGSVREVKMPLDDALRIPAQTLAYQQYLPVSQGESETARSGENASFLEVIGSLYARDDVEVDLVPEEVKSRLEFEEKSRDVIKVGVLAIILLLLVPSFLFVRVGFKGMYLDKLKRKYGPILEEARALEEDYAKVKKLKDFLERERRSLDVLQTLYAKLPDDARCIEIRYDAEGAFTAKGVARTIPEVHALNEGLRDSGLFENVGLPNPEQREDGLVEFEIKCDLPKKAGSDGEEE